MKSPSAFDGLDLGNGENQLFGTDTIDNQHFTEYGMENDTAGGTMADSELIKIMNPLNYIDTEGADTSTYWRIRFGTKDSDTSLAVSTILATTLQNKGYNVDFAMPWDVTHSGDYDLEELFAWADQIVAKSSSESDDDQSKTSDNITVKVNNEDVAASTYEHDGSVYLKLRDLAMAVTGSDKQFEITWEPTKKTVNLVSGKSYTPNGGELAGTTSLASEQVTSKASTIYLDGQQVQLTAYMVQGNNYVKLSEAANLLNLDLVIDSTTNTVTINTVEN